MTTSIQSVPEAPALTRDMGVVENSPSRPPYAVDAAECARQLGDLERFFGTAVFAEALKRYQADPGFDARKRGIDPDQLVRDVESLYSELELPDYAADMVARVRSLPTVTPFPGATAVPAQPTTATAA